MLTILPDDHPDLPAPPGRGRLEGEGRLGEYVDALDPDDETGSALDGGSHFCLVRFGPDDLARAPEGTETDDAAAILSESEYDRLASSAGAIVETTCDGFVYVTLYPTAAALGAAWAETEADCAVTDE